MSQLSLSFVHFLFTRPYLHGVCEIYNFMFCMYTYITVIYQNAYDEFNVKKYEFSIEETTIFCCSMWYGLLIKVVC